MKWISLYIGRAVGLAERETELDRFERHMERRGYATTERTDDYWRGIKKREGEKCV